MKKYLTKKNVFIGLFAVLYLAVALVSLIHSFAFFGLANNRAMSIMLGCCFEIGQMAVLMSILTSKKDRSKFMPWALMTLLTVVQILGNIFSSYKYLITHSNDNLRYFKEPIFVWTDLPDNITTVIITYIVGAILPICALAMTAMVENFLEDNPDDIPNPVNTPEPEVEPVKDIQKPEVTTTTPEPEPVKDEHFMEDEPEDDEIEEQEETTTTPEPEPVKDEHFMEDEPEDDEIEDTVEEVTVTKEPKKSHFINI